MTTINPPESRLPRSQRDWNKLVAYVGIRPSKGRGQNFLFERGVVGRLISAAGITADDVVVEVGPGLGILTEDLLRAAGRVVAVEVDVQLAAHVRRVFGDLPAFELIEADALTISANRLVPPDQEYHVAANLPYSIASAVIRHFLEQAHAPMRMTVMVQREVADRLVATPPKMSILGVATQFFAHSRIAFTVSPTVFIPQPTVESAVVVLDRRSEPRLPRNQEPAFFRLVNAGFRQRRKQLANSVASELDQPKAQVNFWLQETGIDPSRRAETLSVEEWVSLTQAAPPSWLS